MRHHNIEIELHEYDRTKPLVIDPILSYSTYLGGAGEERGAGIAVDAAGNSYIAGSTNSTDIPGAALGNRGGGEDAIVIKLDPTGAVVFSTVIGGGNRDSASAIAVDAIGSVYITGSTISDDFPALGAIQSQCPPNENGVCNGAFVTKLHSSGSVIVYSTFLPGSGATFSSGIAADAAGNVYVAGSTTSTNFPTVNAVQPVSGGGPEGDAFIAKLNPSGTAFLYSTYLGGSGPDRAQAIAVNGNGDAYVTGFTRSPNFPVAGSFQPLTRGATYKTTDGGSEWKPRDTLPASDVTALAVDPITPSIVYAGTDGSGLYKSSDGGATWRQQQLSGLAGSRVTTIALDPSNPQSVYAGAGRGLFRSADAGVTWISGGVVIDGFSVRPLLNITAVVVHPRRPATVFANTSPIDPTGLVKSTNGGQTFTRLGAVAGLTGGPIAIHPQDPAIIFAGDSKSTDGGDTWKRTFISGEATALAINPLNPSTMYLASSSGVFKSTDAGDTWALGSGGTVRLARALAIDPGNPSTLYAAGGFSSGVFKSTDAGATWAAINRGLTTQRINALAVDPQTPAVVYLGASIPFDAFVTRLNAAGSALTYSTLLGGSEDDQGSAVAVDGLGFALVTGFTSSGDFPTANPLQPFKAGDFDVFITRLNSTGALVYSTYFGGSAGEVGLGVAADRSGNAYVVGQTQSLNFPIANPVQSILSGGAQGRDAFALKLNAAGSAVSYSTYLGGSGVDQAYAVAVDSNGNAFVTGETASPNFPSATPGPNQSTGLRDIFAVKLTNTDVASAALSIRVNVTPTDVLTGNNIVYAISIVNTGDSSLQSVIVSDSLPASLNFISCTTSPGGVCGGSGNARSASFTTLAPGEPASVTITARADCSVAGASPILNEVTVGASGIGPVSAQATVRVTNRLPTITCPPGMVIQTSSTTGAAVTYPAPAAEDNCTGLTVICSPPSGGNFPVGTTTVACTARDSGGGAVSCAFNVMVTNSNVPQIDSAAVVGKNLIITGRGFDAGARIVMDGVERKSRNDADNPSTSLIGKKVGKLIARGQTVGLQVRNPSGIASAVFLFRRPE
jgi:uncharacterized repeat protein (TIGR01451 family)